MIKSGSARWRVPVVSAAGAALVVLAAGARQTAVAGSGDGVANLPAATAPAATKPTAVTGRQVLADFEQAYRASLSGAFRRVGQKKDPAADDKVAQYLDDIARHLAAGAVDPFYRPADTPSVATLLAAGDALFAAGCDEPLVHYCHWHLLDAAGRGGEGLAHLRRANAGLRAAAYPERWVAEANCGVERTTDDAAEREAALQKRGVLLAACGRRPLSAAERRLTLRMYDRLAPTAHLRQVVHAEMGPRRGGDPWLLDMLAGQTAVEYSGYTLGAVREAASKPIPGSRPPPPRGRDRPAQSPPEALALIASPYDQKGFTEQLTLARDAFRRAWQRHPDLPEAPAAMIYVAAAGWRWLDEKPLDWFERALAAQVDDPEAYRRTLDALRPAWGGSLKELYQLGRACVAQPRYDTSIPWQFVEAVRVIGQETHPDDPWAVLADRTPNEAVDGVIAGYVAAGGPRAAFFLSARAAMAWRDGRWADARAALDAATAAGGRPDPAAFAYFGAAAAPEVVAEVYARTGPAAADVDAADKAFADPLIAVKGVADKGGPAKDAAAKGRPAAVDRPAALAACRAARGKLPAGDPALPYVDGRVARLEADLAFLAGEWTPMVRTPTLVEWTAPPSDWAPTEWAVEPDGRLHGRAGDARGLTALLWVPGRLGLELGPAYEVAVTVLRTAPRPPLGGKGRPGGRQDGERSENGGGILVADAETGYRGRVELDLDDHTVRTTLNPDRREPIPAAVKDGSELSVRVRDYTIAIFVDGRPVGEPFPFPAQIGADVAVGVGGADGPEIRVANPRVRRLPAADVPAADVPATGKAAAR